MTYLVYNSSRYDVVTIQNYFFYYFTSYYYYFNSSSYQWRLNYCVSIKSSVYTETALNEWLAGVIDGDGYFYTGSSPRFSIEMDRKNLPLMSLIHTMTQGRLVLNIKGRPNIIRVDLSKKDLLISLIHRVNGNIRNTVRVAQFVKLCEIFGIPFLHPISLTHKNAWFTGFFDADGGVRATFTHRSPSITIYVTNKYQVNLIDFHTVFGGYIRPHDNNKSFRWTIDHSQSIMNMVTYFECYPSMSHKANRIVLIARFYALKSIKAFKSDNSNHQEWLSLKSRWLTS